MSNIKHLRQFGELYSLDPEMHKIFKTAENIAKSNLPVLITGESGTGKSKLAHAIHFNSSRKESPFIAENCAAIPENLLECEMFGYSRGAFTGAVQDTKGIFEVANHGTLFLDEIGDMPLNMQAKLLRVLETGEVRGLGNRSWKSLDIRFIFATHHDLEYLVKEHLFRSDLMYRICGVVIEIPPLRERIRDIPLLVERFLAKSIRNLVVSPEAMVCLQSYHWPGNVRQLKYEMERLIVMKHSPVIEESDLSPEIQCESTPEKNILKKVVERFEKDYIEKTISQTNGNKSQAASLLGITRRSLYNKLQK